MRIIHGTGLVPLKEIQVSRVMICRGTANRYRDRRCRTGTRQYMSQGAVIGAGGIPTLTPEKYANCIALPAKV